MDKGYFMLRVTNINRETKNIVNVQMKKLSLEII